MEIRIDVHQDIYAENDRVAKENVGIFAARGLFAVNVMGAPGCGKTTVIRGLLSRMEGKGYVLEGDIESDIDTKALKADGIEAAQFNTHGECHLVAPDIQSALPLMEGWENGVLFIENIGNLVCPAEFAIGENIRMLILSAADGSDKPYKYPLAFQRADIIMLNKADLLPHVQFDETFFLSGVRAQNRNAPVFTVSAKTGQGMEEAAKWLTARAKN